MWGDHYIFWDGEEIEKHILDIPDCYIEATYKEAELAKKCGSSLENFLGSVRLIHRKDRYNRLVSLGKLKVVIINVCENVCSHSKICNTSGLTHLETVNAVVENRMSTSQKLKTNQIERNYATCVTCTTLQSFTTSDANGVAIKSKNGINLLSISDIDLDLTQPRKLAKDENGSTTDIKSCEKTIVLTSQEVCVETNTQVNITSDIYSKIVTDYYLIDLYIESIEIDGHQHTYDLTDSCNLTDFGENEIRIERKDDKFILKNIPVIVERTEHDTKTSYAKETLIIADEPPMASAVGLPFNSLDAEERNLMD